MGSGRKRRKHKGTQGMDICEMTLHAGHELREGVGASRASPGREGGITKACPPPKFREPGRHYSPSSPLSSPQIFADGSDSGTDKAVK